MEPSLQSRPLVVPKLHLFFANSASASRHATTSRAEASELPAHMPSSIATEEQQVTTMPRGHSSERTDRSRRQQPQVMESVMKGTSLLSKPKHTPSLTPRPSPRFSQPPRTAVEATRSVVVPIRASTATVEYLESPRLPPMLQRQLREPTPSFSPTKADADPRAKADAFRVLHPSLDLNDDSGELSKLMLSKWSIDSGEHGFTSISLFCEMKFNEAKRMASWVDTPNRFFATVCCQLLRKYIDRVDAASSAGSQAVRHSYAPSTNGSLPTLGHSTSFLRLALGELIDAIFLPPSASCASNGDPLDNRVPYFVVRKHDVSPSCPLPASKLELA